MFILKNMWDHESGLGLPDENHTYEAVKSRSMNMTSDMIWYIKEIWVLTVVHIWYVNKFVCVGEHVYKEF